MRKLLLLVLLLGLYFLFETSWLTPMQSWQDSSGFSKIQKDFLPKQLEVNSYLAQNNIRMTWLGHAGYLISFDGKFFLLDPNLSLNSKIIHRASLPIIKAEDLPEIEAVLISHAHYDHLDLTTLESIKQLKNIVLPKGSEIYLSEKLKSKSQITPIEKDGVIKISDFEIHQTFALHNGSRNHPFQSDKFATGYVLKNSQVCIYYSGDTGFGPHFEKVKNDFHPDVSILPIGSFKPYFVLRDYHLSPTDAVRAAKILQSKIVLPTHFGTFRLAIDANDEALPLFAKEAAKENLIWGLGSD